MYGEPLTTTDENYFSNEVGQFAACHVRGELRIKSAQETKLYLADQTPSYINRNDWYHYAGALAICAALAALTVNALAPKSISADTLLL